MASKKKTVKKPAKKTKRRPQDVKAPEPVYGYITKAYYIAPSLLPELRELHEKAQAAVKEYDNRMNYILTTADIYASSIQKIDLTTGIIFYKTYGKLADAAVGT